MVTSTPAFHTFTSIRNGLAPALVEALESADAGDDSAFKDLLDGDSHLAADLESQGADTSVGRAGIEWDDATLMLTALMAREETGQAISIGGDLSRDRLGRFPWGDANPLSYMLEWCASPEEDGEILDDLLLALAGRFSSVLLGHERYEQSAVGRLHGWLECDELTELVQLLTNGRFVVNADEPHDGGVNDIVRHLVTISRAALRQECGLLLRSHS